MIRTAAALIAALVLAMPSAALAQTDELHPPIPPPCPWWHCDPIGDVVVEEYRLEATIDGAVATTRITQLLRNDGFGLAEGVFLHPIPGGAAVSGLQLWIDNEPVEGELLDADEARDTYEEIVRNTLDPALLEFVDDGLIRLSVFPIPEGKTRRVELEYQQVLGADGGLMQYRQALGREHGDVEIEEISARIDIINEAGVKTIHSPTHAIFVDRHDDTSATVTFETDRPSPSDFSLYYSIDPEAVAVDVISYRDGAEGWFLLLASPGLVDDDSVTPKDVALVVDVSGSMEGEKVAQARDAAEFVLDNLNPRDRFEVLSFSSSVDEYGGELLPASEADDAVRWVRRLTAGGSTDIHLALDTAFDLADSERPLYVLFLTDGLPTEGIVDTSEILERLRRAGSNSISVFAFGVGYDVDTILLDSIALDHHGTTRYVVPGENIDEAVSSLYSKVASPVLTDVELTVDGVEVFDLQPRSLPDVFSGEQLIVAGRYDGWGPATVTLEGMLKNEPVTIEYLDVRFSAAGGDETVPGLWATRKIGALLREIRIEGPSDETIDQIVRISIRHGIVTPYTSYLVTEDAPFGRDALGEIVERATVAAPTFEASGEESVQAADLSADMSGAGVASAPGEEAEGIVMTAGGRAFRLSEGVWTDTTYDPEMELIRIAFGSDDHFRLAEASPSVAEALAFSGRVLLVIDGTAYEIVEADADSDPLPEGFDVAIDDPVPDPGPSDSDVAAPADDESSSIAGLAFAVALGAVAVAAAAMARGR